MTTYLGTATSTTSGVQGDTTITTAVGVKGTTTSTTAAVYGVSGGDGPGLKSYVTTAQSAIEALNASASEQSWGLNAEAGAIGALCYGGNYGVAGFSPEVGVLGAGDFIGVDGDSAGEGCAAVRGIASDGAYSGFFLNGDLVHSGTGTKSFLIDHPLDPENQYLQHACVESPDVKNVYDGVAIADNAGEATVDLPAYFEALNRDFRYQLTAIGKPAPQLHVKQPVVGNRFVIGGAAAGQEVSWQVTGVRNDPTARLKPFSPEREKPAAMRGLYLCPRAFGQAEEKGLVRFRARRDLAAKAREAHRESRSP